MIATDSTTSSSDENRLSPTLVRTVEQQIHTHVIVLIASLSILFAAAVLHIHNGDRVSLSPGGQLLPEICMFKIATGLPCMGCGLTRSVISCARGDFAAAANYNSVGIAFFVLVLSQIPIRLGQIARLRAGKKAWRLPSFMWVFFPLLGWMAVRWLFVIF